MWTVFIFLNLWVLRCSASSSLPSPINVTFSSVNLRNTLHWSPGNGTLHDTHFTVQYAIYGDSVEGSKGRRVHWRVVRGCTEIVRHWCDLSNETWDLEHGYFARVRAVSRKASSKWASTRSRFDPNLDTSIGPPLVSVEMEDNSAIITLKGPMRYQPNNHTPVASMATIYPQMTYNLSVHNAHRGKMNHFPVVSHLYKYHRMDYDTEYCFSAEARFLSMPMRCQRSAWQCITTPPDPVIGQLKMMVVGIFVPSVCMCMLVVVGYFLYHYLTGKGERSPYILSSPSFNPPPLTFPPENLNLILITVIKPSDIENDMSDPACPKQQRQIASSPSGYHPQRCETPPEPEEPWDDLSIDYGFIAVAPKINARGEEEERERRRSEGGHWNNLKSEHQKCIARESYEKKEWRVEDGHSAGAYTPQVKSYFPQESAHTCSQTHVQTHAQTEMCTLIQAIACTQVNSVPLTSTQAPVLSFQGATHGEDREEEDREFPGLFLNKTPQIGLFPNPLNLQKVKEGGLGEETNGKMRVKTVGKVDGGVEEESQSERAPLLSAYASQNIKVTSTSHADQSAFLPHDYSILRLATAVKIEEDEEEEEEGAICIDWDPKTRKLVLPGIAMEFNKEGGLDGVMQGEEDREGRMGGEEEVNAMNSEPALENVFVRQASEEEAEVQREMERGGERGWETDDIFSKWNLVISMDQ